MLFRSAPKNSRTKAQKENPGPGNQGNKQEKKGRKSSRGRSPSGKKDRDRSRPRDSSGGKQYCYFFVKHAEGKSPACKFGESCKMAHETPPKEIAEKMKPPTKSGSRSPSRGRKKSPGRKNLTGASGAQIPNHCFTFLKTGTCDWEKKNPGKTCNRPHLKIGRAHV